MRYTDLMLDFETLGTGPGCVIISVAAVPFMRGLGKMMEPELCFHKNVDIESCLDVGLKIEPGTLGWWIQKSSLFIELQQDTFELLGVLNRLAAFIRDTCVPEVRVWGKGPSFDQAIARDAYNKFKKELPWKYYNERCYRTYVCGHEQLLKTHVPFEGNVHHPVFDARHQVRCMDKLGDLVLNQEDHELD